MPFSSVLKKISFVSIALVLFLFSLDGISTYASSSEEKLPAEVKHPTLSGGYLVYLPLVSHDYCPACEAVPSPFSISIADLFNADFPSQVQAIKDSGAGWARIDLDWWRIEQNDPGVGSPVYTWTFYDDKLGQITAAGLRPIVIVDGIPAWASNSSCPPIASNHLGDFSQFLTDLVNHYKQSPYSIHHWEIINEPDAMPSSNSCASNHWGSAGSQYAQMLAVAYPAIKAADPQATVLMGGIAYDWFTEYGGPFNRYFIDNVMNPGGGSAYLDALNFHYFPDFHLEWERWNSSTPTCGNVEDGIGTPYSAGGIDVIAKFNHVRNRMQTCFGVNKPIWITELAEHGYQGNTSSLTQQSRYVLQGYARSLAAGAKNVTWYGLKIAKDDTGNYPNEQGLLFNDLAYKKPATASSTNGTDTAAKAVDNDSTTWWQPSAPVTQTIDVDLMSAYTISQVKLLWEATNYPTDYQIQTSNNAVTWTTQLTITIASGGPKTHTFTAVSARYVRLNMTASSGNIQLYNFEVYPNDWTPKPAFYAYKTMTAELKGYEYNRTLSVPGGGEAYVFRSPYPKEKTVAWGSGTLTFTPATQLRVVNHQGTVTFINDGNAGDVDGTPNGSVKLQLSTEPVFIQVVS